MLLTLNNALKQQKISLPIKLVLAKENKIKTNISQIFNITKSILLKRKNVFIGLIFFVIIFK